MALIRTQFSSTSLARGPMQRYNIVWGDAEVDRQTIDWYDGNAEEVARRYERVPGSGSGRDAARLLDPGVHKRVNITVP